MRLPIAITAFMLFAASVSADTLQEVTTHGVTVTTPDIVMDVSFTPDGKFTAMNGQVIGAWRIENDKLCSTSNFDPTEKCVAYPTGKKSGDSFPVTSSVGTATVKIK